MAASPGVATPRARSSSTATAPPSAAGARPGAPPGRRPACRPASSTIAAAPPPATRRPQTSDATQRCLNPGFSERIGNSRRTRGWTRSYATVTSPSRNVSANGAATCVKRWRVPSRQETTDERPLHGRLAADERFVAVLARGVVARIVTGPHDAHRQDPHWPMRYDTGRPSSVIRLRISQPRTTSLPCPAGLRARRPSPMMDL